MECDLSSQKSIREFADKFTKSNLKYLNINDLLLDEYYRIYLNRVQKTGCADQ